jgi:putative redox protein
VRPGFTAVRVEVSLAGPESEERYAELAAAVDEHCPVLDLFTNPVPVSRALVTSG